jgi:SMI1 / KNR4 family (SUKH-1)
MTDHDLDRIEKAIGQPLSPAVRRFFLNYPPELRTTFRELPCEDEDGKPFRECPAGNELPRDADDLIAANDPARSYLLPLDWTPNILILGAGACGETYWVDLDDEKGAVYRFDAGTEAKYSDDIADSLEAFAQALIRSYQDD